MKRKLLRSSTHNGNSPDSRLFASLRCVRLGDCPSSDGIGPLSRLLVRVSSLRVESCPSSDGIDPVSLLLSKFRCVRLGNCPSSDGIDPVSLLPVMLNCVKLGRFLSSGGSVPFNGLGEVAPRMRIAKMRCGIPSKLTPRQLDIAVVAFQLREPVPRRVSFSPQRTLQSAMSPVFVWSETTVVVSHGCVVCPRTSNDSRPETMRSAKSIAAAPAAMYHRTGRPERLFLRRGGADGGGGGVKVEPGAPGALGVPLECGFRSCRFYP